MKFFSLILCSLGFVMGIAQTPTQMTHTFEEYKKAINQEDSKKSSQYIDQETLDYFESVTDMVRKADQQTLKQESFMNKFLVLGIRHGSPADLLTSGTASDFISYAMNSLLGSNTLNKLELGDLTNPSSVPLLIQKSDMGFRVAFVDDNGDTKLNLLKLVQSSSELLHTLQKLSGQDEEEFILSSLQNLTGKPVSDQIWTLPTR